MAAGEKIEIVVLDNSQWDTAMTIERIKHPRALGIKSVSDFVNQVLLLTGVSDQHKLIKTLRIEGHGNSSGFYIGADWIDDKSFTKFKPDLAKLAPFFSRDGDAIVRLGHCEAGKAMQVLSDLSVAFGGVRVIAMNAVQQAALPYDQGDSTECHYYECESPVIKMSFR